MLSSHWLRTGSSDPMSGMERDTHKANISVDYKCERQECTKTCELFSVNTPLLWSLMISALLMYLNMPAIISLSQACIDNVLLLETLDSHESTSLLQQYLQSQFLFISHTYLSVAASLWPDEQSRCFACQ